MTDDQTARLRIFAPDDLSVPSGWPEDVGIAALLASGEPEIFPVHGKEDASEILARIGALTGRDLRQVAVDPPVPDHPSCDMPFAVVARLQAGIESFLARTPEAIEEAADFAVNYCFAADEGLDPSALVRGTGTAAPQDPDPGDKAGDLPGFRPFDRDFAPISASRPALLWRSASGDLVLLGDPDAEPVRLAAQDLLVREDGLALAIRRDGTFASGSLPGHILLPEGCLAFDPPPSGCPVLIQVRARHFLVTPSPGWIEGPGRPDAAVAETPADPTWHLALPRWRTVRKHLAGLFCVVAALSALILLDDAPAREAKTVGALPSLRAELLR